MPPKQSIGIVDGPPFSVDGLYESQAWVESVTMLEEVDDLTTDAN